MDTVHDDLGVANVLETTQSWPVGTATAVAITPRGVTTCGDTSAVYTLASVSKLITAAAVLLAWEEGAFALDEPVPAQLLPTYEQVYGAAPTYRELLAHASGMRFQGWVADKPPRTRRIYSSAGYEVLAAALEHVTGITFADYVQEGLCEPLGIRVVVKGSAGHGFRASADALIPLAMEFLRPRVLSEQTMREAVRVHYPGLAGIVPGYGHFSPCDWGLGFSLAGDKHQQHEGHAHWLGRAMPADTAGHFGQSGVFLWIHRATGCAAVVLTDRVFGSWAQQRWDTYNDALWNAMFN